MSRFFAGKPGGSVLPAVFLGLTLSACSTGVPGVGWTTPNNQISDSEQQRQMVEHRTAAQNSASAKRLVDALTQDSTVQVQAAEAALIALSWLVNPGVSVSGKPTGAASQVLTAATGKSSGARDALPQGRAAQRRAAQNAINSASMLVNALTANSTAAQVQAAGDAVAAANRVIAAASSLSETERAGLTSQLNAIRANLASVTAARDAMMERRAAQKTAAENALNAAQRAVNALSNSSSDAEVQTAADALAAASAAIAAATSLSAADMRALRNRLAMITSMRDDRVGHRQVKMQRTAANNALNAANTAVNAVTNDSTDAQVQAADNAVAVAATAVAAATSLSDADMQALNTRLATIRRNLADAKYRRQVAKERRDREKPDNEKAAQRKAAQRKAADDALDAAWTAVFALRRTSSDQDFDAAAALVNAAETAVKAATSLPKWEQNFLKGRLARIKSSLARAIEDREREGRESERAVQRKAADDALDAAWTAVLALESTSTDQEVAAAAALVNAAETAVKAATKLPEWERDLLKGRLASIKDWLQRAKERREREDQWRERQEQRKAANDALNAAWIAVVLLALSSTDQEVAAAVALVNTAETAVKAATKLPQREQDRLKSRLASIKADLARAIRRRTNSTMARTAATDAENAVMNLATLQTAELLDLHAKKHAMMAKDHADMARKYADMANDANEGARTATTATAAEAARRAAEAAQMKADEYMLKAREEMGRAVAAAKRELTVDGNKYSVGDSMVVDDGSSMTEGSRTTGRLVGVGRVYDSMDDKARLVLHDKYLGSDEIPKAIPYNHVNYGTWTDLNKVGGNDQMPASLGIGFVQKTKGGMRTGSEMPHVGSATYRGAYVANVRAAASNGKGKITSEEGGAQITAHFGSSRVTATLTNLATLTGKISGDGFSGTSATAHGTGAGTSYTGHLPDGSSYSGAFKGHFYGPRAMEAAGVFDFTSAGAKDGEFRGAFGARKVSGAL